MRRAGPTLLIRGFQVRYPRFTVGPLDLSIRPGERVALVGANGAGKTTVLLAAAGLLSTYEGTVRVAGNEAARNALAVRQTVGILPDELPGLGWMRVEEHLALLASLRPEWRASYAAELLDLLKVPAGERLDALSRGNRVKVSFVAAEAFRPALLLLDEPTAGLDPVSRERLLDLLTQAFPPGGARSLLFASHRLEDLDTVAHRVVLLEEGRIGGDWTMEELGAGTGGEGGSRELHRRLTGD